MKIHWDLDLISSFIIINSKLAAFSIPDLLIDWVSTIYFRHVLSVSLYYGLWYIVGRYVILWAVSQAITIGYRMFVNGISSGLYCIIYVSLCSLCISSYSFVILLNSYLGRIWLVLGALSNKISLHPNSQH